jgi:hypothetical protein
MMASVRVKIAVAVDPTGRWYAHSYGDAEAVAYPDNHDEMLEFVDVVEQCGPSEAWFWVTAELPIPEPKEVAGEIVMVKDG